MNTSEHEMNTNVEVIKDIEESDAEPALYSVVDGIRSQKGNATFNYSARKKIEEYLENKILIKLTCDTFDDIG
jgi:hypothetical protein